MVLLIEDHEPTLYALAKRLGHGGYVPLTSRGGSEAVGLLREMIPRAIVLDWRLPGAMDGPEVLRHIRADARYAEVPILVYSAYLDDDEVNREAMAAGATECVAKGVRSDDVLMATLARYVPPRGRA